MPLFNVTSITLVYKGRLWSVIVDGKMRISRKFKAQDIEVKACRDLKLEVLDETTKTLREVLELVVKGAEVEDLNLAEKKAKELYRTALDVWAKLKERQLIALNAQ